MVGNTPDRSRLEETEKKAFFGHFRLCEVCTYLRTSIVNPFESTNFIQRAVHEIWKITEFRHYKAPENKKIYFRELLVV